MARFVEAARGGARLRIRLTPNARQEGFGGLQADSEGQVWLKASVRAIPEAGKANDALVALVAKASGIAKGWIEIASGHTSRTKVLFIDGAQDAEIAALEALENG